MPLAAVTATNSKLKPQAKRRSSGRYTCVSGHVSTVIGTKSAIEEFFLYKEDRLAIVA
jgi:hypothetical protein